MAPVSRAELGYVRLNSFNILVRQQPSISELFDAPTIRLLLLAQTRSRKDVTQGMVPTLVCVEEETRLRSSPSQNGRVVIYDRVTVQDGRLRNVRYGVTDRSDGITVNVPTTVVGDALRARAISKKSSTHDGQPKTFTAAQNHGKPVGRTMQRVRIRSRQ